jgi:hypothetical protein
MTNYALFLLLFSSVIVGCNTVPKSEETPWVLLFNGTDLTGWTPKFSGYPAGQNFKNTFSVSDSVLHVTYAEYDSFRNEFGHLYTDKQYSNFKLRMDYRIVGAQAPGGPVWGARNSGVMILSQSAQSMGLDQDFPVSVEFQFLGGNEEAERPTGNVCTPGTHVFMHDTLVTTHCIPSSAKTFHGERWVSIEVEVNPDGNIYHIVEGDTVARYARPVIGGDFLPEGYPIKEGERVSQGYIALQAESHNVDFKNIRIQEWQ